MWSSVISWGIWGKRSSFYDSGNFSVNCRTALNLKVTHQTFFSWFLLPSGLVSLLSPQRSLVPSACAWRGASQAGPTISGHRASPWPLFHSPPARQGSSPRFPCPLSSRSNPTFLLGIVNNIGMRDDETAVSGCFLWARHCHMLWIFSFFVCF